MASKAWNTDGDVLTTDSGIPLGAVRKAFFHHKDTIKAVTKLIINSTVYDIDKQSKEGMVVVGYNYKDVTFFLPEDRAEMTASDGKTMSIYDYLAKLATTTYSEIAAWDHFANTIGEMVRSLLEQNDIPTGTTFPYTFAQNKTDGLSYSGSAVFDTVTTAKEFFNSLYTSIDASAADSKLSEWFAEEDNAVSMLLTIQLSSDNKFAMPMYVGRK